MSLDAIQPVDGPPESPGLLPLSPSVAAEIHGALPPPTGPNVELQLIELRRSFALIFKAGIGLVLGVLLLVVGSLIYMSADHRDGPPPTPEILLLEKYATIRLMQVSFGMLIGFCCVFFGILLSWLGITSAYSLCGSGQGLGGKGSLTIQSASPGLALMVGGIILTGISLSNQINFQLPSMHISGAPYSGGGVSQMPTVYMPSPKADDAPPAPSPGAPDPPVAPN